jgi:hypothetical protein
MNFKTMNDIKKNEKKDKKATESYTGGERSGLAVENPSDPLSDIVNQARQNTTGKESYIK